MLLRSHDGCHSDLSSFCCTDEFSDMEKDKKNVFHVPDSGVG